MTVYLHYGMQKTGTTSLQRSFHRKRAWGDCAYVSYGRIQSNALVEASRSRSPEAFRIEVDRTLGAEIRKSPAGKVIISSEALPFLDRSSFLSLVEGLQATGRNVHVLGYIRKPKSFMESIFQQRIKQRQMTAADIADLYPGYRKKFSKMEDARTKLGVSVDYWLFDPVAMEERCVVRDFCRGIGATFSGSDVVVENVGLSLPAIQLLQLFYARSVDTAGPKQAVLGNRLLVGKLAGVKGPRFRLHSEVAGPVLAANAEDIAWMEERLGTSLSEDIAAGDELAVRDMADLMRPGADVVDWLWHASGVARKWTAPAADDASPDMIAEAMTRLRDRLVRNRKQKAPA